MTGGNDSNSTKATSSGIKSTNCIDTSTNQRLTSSSWSNAMTLAIGGRQKLNFISENTKRPVTTSPKFELWFSQDQLVRSWLINSMEPKLHKIFQYVDYALSMWNSVKELNGHLNDSARVFQIRKDLAELKQGSLTFVEHLGNFKAKWNELDLYRLQSTELKVILKRAEEGKIFELLCSLGPEYEDLKSLNPYVN